MPRMIALLTLPLLTLPLAACATAAPVAEVEPPRRPLAENTCDAAAARGQIGQRATAALGAELLRLTGARSLRWVPPRTAVTMDFRGDRLTVSYDDNMVIERISCG